MVARAINGKLDLLSVLRVEHNGVLCETQAAIEGALFPINKAKVHSSEDTDFLQPPLVDIFGYQGNEDRKQGPPGQIHPSCWSLLPREIVLVPVHPTGKPSPLQHSDLHDRPPR